MTDHPDENNENDEKTQEQCSHDEENTREQDRAPSPFGLSRYGKSAWVPSMHTHVFTADGKDVDELLESLPDERLDDLIYVEPSDDPECGAFNALKPLPKRVRKELDAEPLDDPTERDGLYTLRSGDRITGGKLRGPTTTDTLTAFEMLGSIDREARKYRKERIISEFGSVPEYMQSVIDDLEELARTAPHFPPHPFSPSRPAPAMYPIKHIRGRGSAVGPWVDVLQRMFEDEEDEDA